MSKLQTVSRGSVRGKYNHVLPYPRCIVKDCHQVPPEGRFYCKEHWELQKFLKDDWWSKTPCSERYIRYYCKSGRIMT